MKLKQIEKNFKLASLAIALICGSCESGLESQGTDMQRIKNSTTLIDPTTDPDVQPFLADVEKKGAPSSAWKLVFSDEFNSFDASKWNKTVSKKTRDPRWKKGIHKWFWKEDHVSVANGKLALKATKPSEHTMYCGSVDSRGLFEPTYGYLEARMQIAPTSEAVHTAFWTQGHSMGNVDGTGHDGAEVDIFESPNISDKCQTVLHWDGYGKNHRAKTKHWSAPNLHTGFHTFAMKWEPNQIQIFYDGVLKWTYTGVGIPRVKEWLWLSVGASFGDGDFANGTYPVYAYVDYVRVWEIPESIQNECENLEYYSPTGQQIDVMTHSLASGGKHLRLKASGNDNRIRFNNLHVPKSGTYSVKLNGLTWSSFGRYKCSISTSNGWRYFTPEIDLYSNSSSVKTVNFGTVYLSEGNHHITFSSTGKNSKSGGYLGSFDKITLTLVE